MNKKYKLQAVLFDVDGTLADTEQDGHRLAFNAAFKQFNLDWNWDIELYGQLLAVTGGKERIRHYMEIYDPAALEKPDVANWIASLHKTKTNFFEDLMETGSIPLRPGVARLIHELRQKEIRLAIATTTTMDNVTALLKSTLGEESIDWFDVIGAGDIVPLKKPAPDIYQWVLNQLELTPQQCIAIEDSENGLKAAISADLITLITVSGYTQAQNFEGAVSVLSDLGEPSQPYIRLSGPALTQGWIDYHMLNTLMNH